MDVDSFASAVYGKGGKSKDKVYQKGGKVKGKTKDKSKSKTKFEGTCFVCGKTGHMKADCWYKDTAVGGKGSKGKSTKSKTAAVITEQPDTPSVMKKIEAEYEEAEEAKGDSWVFAMGSRNRTDLILFDSGSDEHVCGVDFAPSAPLRDSTNTVTMRDAQGNIIKHPHQRDVHMTMMSDKGEIPGKTTFEVAEVPGAILSAGKLIQKGFKAVLDANGSYIEKNGRRVQLIMKKNSFYLPANVMAINDVDDEHMTGGSSASTGAVAPRPDLHNEVLLATRAAVAAKRAESNLQAQTPTTVAPA